MVVSTALMCLALNVFHESRGEHVMGQFAVAQVTQRRAEKTGSVCKAVFQRKQFSWANRGVTAIKDKHGNVVAWRVSDALTPKEVRAWEVAMRVSKTVLSGAVDGVDFARGAMFYHTRQVSPKWARNMVRTAVIGGHYFYKEVTQA